jgi:hypothetical protein
VIKAREGEDIMKLWINAIPRKDHKYSCTYGFNNGRRFRKIRTSKQLISELSSAFNMDITEKDFNNTLFKARQTREDAKLFYEF